MADTGLFYWQEKLGKTQPRIAKFCLNITGAVTVAQVPQGQPILNTFSAIASQSVIDDFLGTSDEFDYLAFDATAMGADAQGLIVNMGGQVKSLIYGRATCYSGTAGATKVELIVQPSSALTASTLVTECALGASGNLAMKMDWGNTPDFDGLTSGLIVVEFAWISK